MPNDYTGLLTGSHWSGIEVMGKPVIVTYSFPQTIPGYVPAIDDPNLTPAAIASWQAFGPAEQALARAALAEWGNNSGLIFIEVAPGHGDINFQKLDFSGTGYDGAGGIGYRPFGDWSFFSTPWFVSDLDGAGDIFMNSDFAINYGTLLHEIGHAIGLKHPTEPWTQYALYPPVTHSVWTGDDPNLTIMSQLPGGGGHLTAIDIQAVQAIYGTQAQDGTQVSSWSWNAGTQTLTQVGFGGADAIRGSSVHDSISGGNGNDRLYGLADSDTLRGGGGEDTLDGGEGSDLLVGGTGNDVYFVTPGDRVTEAVGGGIDTVYASASYRLPAEVEELRFLGNAAVTGTGNDLDNALYAGGGAARLLGMGGNDYMVGGEANDFLTGGTGSDTMWGGNGADRFIFNSMADFGPALAPDVIGDFSRAQKDRIDLRLIDPDSIAAGDQAFSFIGTAAFSVDARFQVRYQIVNGNTEVQIDINHDRVADATILLYGAIALAGSDFLL